MNSYKLNGIAGHVTRSSICKKLNILHTEIYKEIKSLSVSGVVETKDGKLYQIELTEIETFNTKEK